jgi:hypothetical protein
VNRSILLLVCATSLLLCVPSRSFGSRVEPIYDATIRVPATAKMDDIAKAIKSALIAREWTMQREENGVIEAKLFVRSHTADIRIPFDKEYVHIQYVSSTNLLYDEKQGVKHIHRNYNKWIKLLERDITNRLAVLNK